MIVSLKGMFRTQIRTERFNIAQALIGGKLEEGDLLELHAKNSP